MISELAKAIAEKIFPHISDRLQQEELRELLIEFANEIKGKSRFDIIREQQRNPADHVTAIMVSRETEETSK